MSSTHELSRGLSPAAAEESLRIGLTVLAGVSFAIAVFMVAAPHAFFTAIGPFGVANEHYIRDTATFYAAMGLGQALAVTRPSWREPVLVITAAQYLLHALNHLFDIAAARPAWIGYMDFVSLLATGLAVLWLLRLARREKGAPRA